DDLLRFVFPRAERIFDLERGSCPQILYPTSCLDIFEEEIDRLTGKSNTMGLIEQIRQMKLDEARAEARKEARKEAAGERNRIFVTNLLNSTSFSVKKIAQLAGVSESFVNRVKASLKK
ncbi:MAG TPA: hypothetical protein VIM64_02675, partial [Puia sp.]